MMIINPSMFQEKRPSRNEKLKKIAKIAGGIAVAGAVTLAGLAATNRLKVTNPNKYTYSKDNAKVWKRPFFGRDIFISAIPFTNKDKLDPEGYKIIKDSEPAYKSNAQLTAADQAQIAAKLTARGFDCPPDAVVVNPINRDTVESTTTTVAGQTPLGVRICLDFGKLSLKGDSFVVPLGLENRAGTPQQINETVRTAKCIGWGVKYSGIVNRDVIYEMQAANLPTNPGDQYPVIIHMSATLQSPCNTDSVNIVTKQK